MPTGPNTDPDGRFYAEQLRGAANHLAPNPEAFGVTVLLAPTDTTDI